MKKEEKNIPIHESEIAKFKHAKYLIRAYDIKNKVVGEEKASNRIEIDETTYTQRTTIDKKIVVTQDTVVNSVELWYATNSKPYEMVGMRKFPGLEMDSGDSLHVTFSLQISWADNEIRVYT